MSLITDLIKEHCPEGVPTRPLGEVGELVRGNGMPKTSFTDTGVGAIHYGQIYTHFGTSTTETIAFVAPETATRLKKVDPGDVIITNTSENLDDVGKAVAWLGKDQIVTGGHATVLKHSQDPKFIAYWFQSPSFRRQKRQVATGTKVMDVSAKQLAKIQIPVPPIEVQREIARVLEHFSEMEAELETELRAELKERRRQYNHFRTALLTFGDDPSVRRVTLGEVCTRVSSGGTPRAGKSDYYDGGDIPWLRTQEVVWRDVSETRMKITAKAVQETAAKWIPANCVIVAISGASAARAAVNKIPLTTNQHCCNLEIDGEQASYRYVFQWVSDNYEKLKALGQGARSDLNGGLIKSFPIALPPLPEQERIAQELDSFDGLINDLSVDLRAELGSRRTQFEYYRDKLLTFEEAVA